MEDALQKAIVMPAAGLVYLDSLPMIFSSLLREISPIQLVDDPHIPRATSNDIYVFDELFGKLQNFPNR